MASELNKHLIREPAAFGLLDRLSTCDLWEFTEAEQTKILEAAYLLFAPFEKIYLADPDNVEAHPSYPQMQSACALIRTGGWPEVWQVLWNEKRLDGEFCAFALHNAAGQVPQS